MNQHEITERRPLLAIQHNLLVFVHIASKHNKLSSRIFLIFGLLISPLPAAQNPMLRAAPFFSELSFSRPSRRVAFVTAPPR